jgi:hypothetical protein
VATLPPPNTEGISCRQQQGGTFAARTFSGLATEEGSKQQEQLLRWAAADWAGTRSPGCTAAARWPLRLAPCALLGMC